jgi:hypothetical protein
MCEYRDLKHMTPVPREKQRDRSSNAYYIVWLPVLLQHNIATKLRNVLNASAKCDNGVSLNDTIYTGPKLQTSISDILTRMRKFKYVYAADIEKKF